LLVHRLLFVCLFLTAVALAFFCCCQPKRPVSPPTDEVTIPGQPAQLRRLANPAPDVLTVLITGHELGALKPCGCSGGQLGGLDRRAYIINSVPKTRRVVLDTGRLIAGDDEQELIKFDIIVQALKLLDYDLLHLTGHDLQIAANLGTLEELRRHFALVGSEPIDGDQLPRRFIKRFSLRGKSLSLAVAAVDTRSRPIQQLTALFDEMPAGASVRIAIVNQCSAELLSALPELAQGLDCIICPADADEPRLISQPGQRPMVVSVGRYGKYVSALRVRLPSSPGPVQLEFFAVPVVEDLPQDPSLVNLYKAYQQIVRQSGLLERQVRFPLPDGLQYVGSETCKECHGYAYSRWSTQAHARAFETLERVGSDYDPQCVVCHVVGMQYDSGFITARTTPNLKGVGCENCHGPGSKHITSAGAEELGAPRSSCTDCHSPDHSAEYAGHEEQYFRKIIHWPEQNAAPTVK